MKNEVIKEELNEIRGDMVEIRGHIAKVENELDDERRDRKEDKKDARMLLGFMCLACAVVLLFVWVKTASWSNAYETIGSIATLGIGFVLLLVGAVCVA